MALTKKEIINTIHEQTAIHRRDCVHIVENVFEIITEELQNGNTVKISGFGQWNVRQKRARRVLNPQTGEAMTIDERKVVTFKVSQAMRHGINCEEI